MRCPVALCGALLVAALAVSCNREPPDLREWRPSDHDHTSEPNAGQAPSEPSPAAQAAANRGVDDVTIVAWKQNCIRCHGVVGAGDGPQGPSVHARNLTDPAWQATVTDEQLATSIRSGKGSMPAFPLPQSTIGGLVRLVRLLNAQAQAQAEPEPEPAADSGQGGDPVLKPDAGR